MKKNQPTAAVTCRICKDRGTQYLSPPLDGGRTMFRVAGSDESPGLAGGGGKRRDGPRFVHALIVRLGRRVGKREIRRGRPFGRLRAAGRERGVRRELRGERGKAPLRGHYEQAGLAQAKKS